MDKDDQQNKVQICRKLGVLVNEILGSSKKLQSVLEELSELYKPKSQEETDKFYSLEFDLPDCTRLLCDLRKIETPDDYKLFDAIAPLRDMSIDIANRIIGANVIITDIIAMYKEPHNDMYIHLYLTVLKPVSNSILYLCDKLDKLHKEISQQWPELLVLDDDAEEEEESVLPGEVESFQVMRSILAKTLKEYTQNHESERISNFILAIKDYLENFANGIEPDMEFDFGFSLDGGNDEYHEIKYIDFHFESEMLQISSGGSVYDESVGSDSYSDWDYSIGLNGWDEDNNSYRFSIMLELVRSGAKLSIENPDEYSDDEEDEDEDE